MDINISGIKAEKIFEDLLNKLTYKFVHWNSEGLKGYEYMRIEHLSRSYKKCPN